MTKNKGKKDENGVLTYRFLSNRKMILFISWDFIPVTALSSDGIHVLFLSHNFCILNFLCGKGVKLNLLIVNANMFQKFFRILDFPWADAILFCVSCIIYSVVWVWARELRSSCSIFDYVLHRPLS